MSLTHSVDKLTKTGPKGSLNLSPSSKRSDWVAAVPCRPNNTINLPSGPKRGTLVPTPYTPSKTGSVLDWIAPDSDNAGARVKASIYWSQVKLSLSSEKCLISAGSTKFLSEVSATPREKSPKERAPG